MRLDRITGLLAVSFACYASGAEEAVTKPRNPCTIKSPTSGLDFDLHKLAVALPEPGSKKQDDKVESWTARGYDYPANFTINICAPVVESVEKVQGVEEKLWQNVSAYYQQDGKIFSIGQQSSELVFRGRKLVLNYTDGSPCKGDEDREKPRRKSTIISFLCEQDNLETSRPKVALSFVGTSDECAYFFEARSPLSCGGAAPVQQAVGPGSVFGIILLIALAVYVFGGIAYQRTVLLQRGWRQIPNYSMWAGIASFFKDMFIILFSSCTRCLPKRRGYTEVPSAGTRGRGGNREDENRLIDSLDEEWDE